MTDSPVAMKVRKGPNQDVQFAILTEQGTAIASLPVSEARKLADTVNRYADEIEAVAKN